MSTPTEVTLDVHGLCKTYGEGDRAVLAVRDANFKTKPGEFVAVVGPSGSGKTTLLAMIGGLLTPTSGSILVNGRDIAQLGRGAQAAYRRDSVGYVFQANNLLPFLTARENLMVMAQITGGDRKSSHERAERLLDELGLTSRADAVATELSGGEKQRVAIARTILKGPPILMLDEATSALDSHTEKEIQDALDRVSKGRTTLVIAHRLSTVQRADLICVMEDGRIIERGRHGELIASKGVYSRLAGSAHGSTLVN